MSGFCVTVIWLNEMIPASISPTNRTIGATGLRMHHEEMLRKFMATQLTLVRAAVTGPGYWTAARLGCTFWPGLRNGPADSTTDSLPVSPAATVTPASLTLPIVIALRSTSLLA